MDYNQNLTFKGLASAIANSMNCSLQYAPQKSFPALFSAMRFWVIKHLSINGFGDLRVLPDRELKCALYVKMHHGKGIARIYPTIGSGFIQIEIIPATDKGLLAETVYEEILKPVYRPPTKNQLKLLGRLTDRNRGLK